MKNKTFLLTAITVLFLCQFTPLWTQGEPKLLEEIWRREESGMTFERVCKPGRLVKMSKYKDSDIYLYLIDLQTGETIYKTDPKIDGYTLEFNYFGDRYYLQDQIKDELREYDVKTKEFKRVVKGIISASDSSLAGFDYTSHSLMFRNGNTGVLLDSFKIPNTPNTPLYQVSSIGYEFSIDSRYFFFGLYNLWNQSTNHYYLYDRQTREIIWKDTINEHESLRYQFFNTSNKIAFAEEVQLPGDDKVYSYIRIFDPDSRTIIKDIRVKSNNGFLIGMDDKKLIYRQGSYNEVFDLEKDKYLDYSHYTIFDGWIMFDTDILYCYYDAGGLSANRLDWTVGIEDATTQELNTIYPNPTNGLITLNITTEFNMGEWNISDMQGRILKKGLIGHSHILEINISDLVPGTYFVTIIGTDNKQSHKIIKL
jgi:hypothetical protein